MRPRWWVCPLAVARRARPLREGGSARALLRQLGQLPRFEANADSGFFQTAKSIGDVRALVAEASFGKPLAKVKVMSSTATP